MASLLVPGYLPSASASPFPHSFPPLLLLSKGRKPCLVHRSFLDRRSTSSPSRIQVSARDSGDIVPAGVEKTPERREILFSLVIGFVAGAFSHITAQQDLAMASEFADMPALRGKDYGKSKMRFPDYTETKSGLQYKDLRVGDGSPPKTGEIVVVDWDGYTIGYYGRIFEARNKTKGGSFEGGNKDFFRFKLGFNQVIPAFEEAVTSMSPGGIRRIIVPPELGYPDNDFDKLGPKPTTFSGQRALDFVLKNQGLIDKTLLFDIELLKVLPS